ncbi:MAG: ferritin-like domain-containing protein [Candidatus Wallbacteria bacterium]
MIKHIMSDESEILINAYRLERREIRKYSLAALAFKESRSCEFFKKLTADETLHVDMIKKRTSILSSENLNLFNMPDIFTIDLNKEVIKTLTPLEFLNFSLLEEQTAALFHHRAATMFESKELKQLFTELEAAEIAHINSIRYEIDFLKNSKNIK